MLLYYVIVFVFAVQLFKKIQTITIWWSHTIIYLVFYNIKIEFKEKSKEIILFEKQEKY